MFFIFGISSKVKHLDFLQTKICKNCGKFGRLNLFMSYTYFSLFFIPIIRWGVNYHILTSCCGTAYLLDKELGKRIMRGESVQITDADLQHEENPNSSMKNLCPDCSCELQNGYEFCPKCGKKLL